MAGSSTLGEIRLARRLARSSATSAPIRVPSWTSSREVIASYGSAHFSDTTRSSTNRDGGDLIRSKEEQLSRDFGSDSALVGSPNQEVGLKYGSAEFPYHTGITLEASATVDL